jgi:hypothetical protein
MEDDIRIGLGFMGQIGMFKELPKKRYDRCWLYCSD